MALIKPKFGNPNNPPAYLPETVYIWFEQPLSGEPSYPKVNSIPVNWRMVSVPPLNPTTMDVYFDSMPAMLNGVIQTGFIGYYNLLDPVSGEYLYALRACNVSIDWNQTIQISGHFEDYYGNEGNFSWPVTIMAPPTDILMAPPSGATAKLDLLSGKTVWIGNTDFEIVDKDGVFTRFIRENSVMNIDSGMSKKTPLNDFIEIWQGFEGQSESEFQLIAAGWLKDVKQTDGAKYTLRIYDMQKLLDITVFQYTGSYNISGGGYTQSGCLRFVQNAGTIGNHTYQKLGDLDFFYAPTDTKHQFPMYYALTGGTPFSPVTKLAIYPDDYYGATYEDKDGWRPFYIGIGYDQNQLLTLKYDNKTPTAHDEVRDTSTRGYNPIDLLLSLLLSTDPADPLFKNPNNDKSRTGLDDPGFDWRTPFCGASIPISNIDVEEFIRIRDTYFASNFDLSFQIKESVNLQAFIENEICKVFGLNLVPKNGMISIIINRPPAQLANAVPVAALTDGSDENGIIQPTADANIIAIPELTVKAADVVNTIRIKWDWDVFDELPGKFAQSLVNIDLDSQTMYGESKEFVIESKGLKSYSHTNQSGYEYARRRALDVRLRYRDAPVNYRVLTNMTLLHLNVGDPVTLTCTHLLDLYDISKKASRGLRNQLTTIVNRKVNWELNCIEFILFDERYGKYLHKLIPADSIPDYMSNDATIRRTYMFISDVGGTYPDAEPHNCYLKLAW